MNIHSFQPIIDKKSRVLILGTVPGPVAFKTRQFYGFKGNHFWPIMVSLFAPEGPKAPELAYAQKVRLVLDHQVAIWDVVKSCRRVGSSDSAMTNIVPTDIPGLLREHRGIQAVFLNGKSAEQLYRKFSADRVTIPSFGLPSTSPANASIGFQEKLKKWSVITKFL